MFEYLQALYFNTSQLSSKIDIYGGQLSILTYCDSRVPLLQDTFRSRNSQCDCLTTVRCVHAHDLIAYGDFLILRLKENGMTGTTGSRLLCHKGHTPADWTKALQLIPDK